MRGVGPAIGNPPGDVTQVIGQSNSSFKLPPGFSLNVFAKNLPGARVAIFDSKGNIWLSQTGEGIVSELTIQNGQWKSQKTVFSGLKHPHGLAFDPENPDILYIAQETEISKVNLAANPLQLQKIIDLPKGGNHFTRTLGFGPNGRLYVSIGSTCNVCHESNSQYASIYSLKKDGTDFRQLAKGLRNSVFFISNQKDGKIWAADMGRDLLGDDVPPDEINIIDSSSAGILNFGWPICYGKNIHDTQFDHNTYIRNPCMEPFELPSHIDIQAHSAPLGLAFVPDDSAWPQGYQHSLMVAFHGSWNRTAPTGYKVVRFILDDKQNLVSQEDFITGWLTESGALGRPVDIIFDQSGNMYLTDDKAGVIYKVVYTK